ncbi:MAG: beta-L-arabinofuranosidase domain-containing protein [Kiritimatiellia bacterium]
MKRLLFAAAALILLRAAAETRLRGYLGARLDAMIQRHVIGTDVDYLTAPFQAATERNGGWSTEFWGKYMHSAMPYLAYTHSEKLRANVTRGLDSILASQEPGGYIGNYPDALRCGEGWDVWGIKYTLMGLLHFADGSRDAEGKLSERGRRALAAAKRLCDYVMDEIGPDGRRGRELWQTGNWSGYASSSILEPVVWLYRRTGEMKYLDFATYIVKGMTNVNPKGPRLLDLALKGVSVADRNEAGAALVPEDGGDWTYVCKYGRGKAYEMMSCCQGILDYVDAKGEGGTREDAALANLRRAALMTGEDIAREEVNLAGGCASSEAWYHGARKQHLPYTRLQETCVTTTWMRFCEKLLSVTDDPRWADQIERTFYNAYLGALKADGSEFAGYTPLTGTRYHGQHHCFMHTDCCTANGPRGFLCFLNGLFTLRDDVATFNFYTTARVDGKLASGKSVAFEMYTLYPRADSVRLVSHAQTVGALPVRFRIPGWVRRATVKLNGETLPDVTPGAYFTVRRAWRLGDVVELAFEMPVVAHRLDHSIAFTRGPILLARDSRFADGDLAEVFRRGIRDGAVMTSFTPVRTPSDDIWMTFSATLPLGSHHENPEGDYPTTVTFCDYASAGGAWRRDNYYRTWFPVEIAPESR